MTPVNSEKAARFQNLALGAGILGTGLCAFAFFSDREHLFQSYLWAYQYWLGLTLGSLGFLLLHQLVGGNWVRAIRKILEASASNLPLMLVLFIPLLLNLSQIYPWAKPEGLPHHGTLHHQAAFFHLPLFTARAAFYFAVWLGIFFLLRAWSRKADGGATARLKGLGGIGLVLFSLTASFACIDWMMSLETGWFSSIYGFLVIAGYGLTTLAFSIVILARWTPKGSVSADLYHDLGKLMFAFTLLWTYASLSQLIIIWSANLPEEIIWYLHRLEGGWKPVTIFVPVFQFAVPFFVLLNMDLKRRSGPLSLVALGILSVFAVNLFWMIEPTLRPEIYAHWTDAAAFVAVGGLWLAAFSRTLKSQNILEWYKHESH